MRDETRLYHNRLGCSKCQAALDLLRDRGIEPRLIDVLAQPPDVAELERLVAQLGVPVRALLRTSEPDYQHLGLDDAELTDLALLTAMAAHPHLIERPIVVHAGRAVIGRPTERVLELL